MKRKTEMIHMMMLLIGLGKYLKRVMIAVSVLVNVVLGGDNNQTFSARNHQWKRDGKPNIVFFIDSILGRDHCMNSWSYWKVRKRW